MAGAIASVSTALKRETKGVVAIAQSTATLTLDLSQGSLFVVTLGASVTGWDFSNVDAASDEVIEVHFVQDGTGTRTLAGASSKVKLAGGALTLTTTAGKRDIVTFRRIGTGAGTIFERSRALNI